MRHEQTFRCRHDGHTVMGTRDKIEREMGAHLMEAHKITDSLRMGLSIERIV
jgi:hypothetical protein